MMLLCLNNALTLTVGALPQSGLSVRRIDACCVLFVSVAENLHSVSYTIAFFYEKKCLALQFPLKFTLTAGPDGHTTGHRYRSSIELFTGLVKALEAVTFPCDASVFQNIYKSFSFRVKKRHGCC